MRPVLFLDLDGVLNCHLVREPAGCAGLEPHLVGRFNALVATVPDMAVVLSSAWRYMIVCGSMTLTGFHAMLRTHGVSKELDLVGYVPADEAVPGRGCQIDWWMKNRAILVSAFPVTRFAILDDAPPGMDFAPHEDKLVKVGRRGLAWKDVDRVVKLLKEGR